MRGWASQCLRGCQSSAIKNTMVRMMLKAPMQALQLLLQELQVDQERLLGGALDVRHGHRGENAQRAQDQHRLHRQAALLPVLAAQRPDCQ